MWIELKGRVWLQREQAALWVQKSDSRDHKLTALLFLHLPHYGIHIRVLDWIFILYLFLCIWLYLFLYISKNGVIR